MANVTVGVTTAPSKRRDSRSLSGWVALLALLANLVVAYVTWGSGSNYPVGSFYLLASFSIASFMFSVMFYVRKPQPLQFMTIIYWIYGLVLPGLYQVRTRDFYWKSSGVIGDAAVDAAGLIVLVGTIFYFIGLGFSVAPIRPRSMLGRTPSFRQRSYVAFWLSFAVLLYCAYLLRRYGVVVYFAPREIADYALQRALGANQETSIAGSLARTFPMSASIAILAVSIEVRARQRSWVAGFAVLFAVLSNLVVNFPIAVPRYFVVALVATTSTVLWPHLFSRFKNLLYFSAPAVLYLVFPLLGTWNRGLGLRSGASLMALSDFLKYGDVDGVQSIMNVANLVQIRGYSLGVRIVSDVLFFVPRSIWSAKSLPTGLEAAELAGYKFLNISMPLPGEFFADFGYAGVAVGMFSFGALIRYLSAFLTTAIEGASAYKISSALLFGFLPIIVRGSLLSTIQAFMIGLIIVVSWDFFSRLSFRK